MTNTPALADSHRRWLFAGVVLLGLIYLIPDLASRTLDHDGVIYANIAMLFTQGNGTFWSLPFPQLGMERFPDHPPLGIYLLAEWMELVGTSVAGVGAEKLWMLLLYVCLAGCMYLTPRITHSAMPAWWPMLCVLVMPIYTGTVKGNYLEPAMLVACWGAVLAIWRAWQQPLWGLTAGVCVAAAVLIKGPAGLFPLAAPLGLWWMHGQFLRPFMVGCLMLASAAAVLLSIVVLFPGALDFASSYWQQQVWASITGARTPEHGRLQALLWLGTQTVAGVGLCALLSRRFSPAPPWRFWMTVAIAASLPVLASARQYDHYLFTALPFLALTICHLIPAPRPAAWLLWRGFPVILGIGCIALAYRFWGTPGDHAHHLQDTATVARSILPRTTLAVCNSAENLRIRGYLYRYHQIHLQLTDARNPTTAGDWLLCGTAPVAGATSAVELRAHGTLWRMGDEAADH